MPKPRALVVGYLNNKVYTYTSSFLKALAQLEYVVHSFDHRTVPWYIPSATAGFLGKKIHEWYVNLGLRRMVKKTEPAMLFVIKGDTLWPNTLRWIKKKYPACQLVHLYPDNPFVVWNANSSIHVLKGLPFYDLFLIWSVQLLPVLLGAGVPRAAYMPLAFDPEVWYPVATVDHQWCVDVCFVGTWDPDREAYLAHLKASLPRIRLHIWGNEWKEACQRHPILQSCWQGQAMYGPSVCELFGQAKIVLNFIRTQNMDAHNMRTFEVLACHGFLLTQYTTDQAERLFTRGVHLDCFDSPDSLVSQVRYYLERPEARASCVAAGHAAVQKYTITHQLRITLDTGFDRSYKGAYEYAQKTTHSHSINP